MQIPKKVTHCQLLIKKPMESRFIVEWERFVAEDSKRKPTGCILGISSRNSSLYHVYWTGEPIELVKSTPGNASESKLNPLPSCSLCAAACSRSTHLRMQTYIWQMIREGRPAEQSPFWHGSGGCTHLQEITEKICQPLGVGCVGRYNTCCERRIELRESVLVVDGYINNCNLRLCCVRVSTGCREESLLGTSGN